MDVGHVTIHESTLEGAVMSVRTRRAAHAALAAVLTGAIALTSSPAPAAVPGRAAPDRADRTSGAAAADTSRTLGQWKVRAAGADTWEVTWRSPSRLPVTSDRPTIVMDGAPIGVPTVRDDGRTVVTTVTSRTRPTAAALDVVLSGDRLDVPGTDGTDTQAAPASPRRLAPQLDADPAEPGTYDVVSSDYELDPVQLPRMKEPIEMVGHVVEPAADADTGPRPLVLFLHGRHSYCYDPTGSGADEWSWPCQAPALEIPSHLGYDYIQQVLASQGFATVSVRVNGINAQDYRLSDGGADARAQIVQEHLDHWVDLAGDHQVDLSQVVLVGHSRGGEGVDRASIQIPLSAPYTIVGQVLLAPTNFGTQTAPYVPTVTVLPYCDGDVFDLQGQRFTDSGRDLLPDDTSLKSSVMVLGANHNFFNTEWTPGIAQAPAWDDWYGSANTLCGTGSPTRLTDSEQRRVGVAYVAGAVQLFTRDDQSVLPLFDGSVVRPPSIGTADVRSHALGGGREVRRPAIDTGLSLTDGATTSFCQGVYNPDSADACGRGNRLYGQVPHWYDASEFAPARRELQMSWSDVGQSGGLVLEDPLDLSTGRLELRTIVDPTLGDVRLRLRLTDAEGDSAVVTPADDGLVRALRGDRFVAKRWAQTVIADPADATGIDLTRVTQVDVIGDSEDGRIWVLDLAAAPDTLAPVPDKRVATVSIGSLRVLEGDGNQPATVGVPFTVTGDLTSPAQLLVGVVDSTRRRGGRSEIRLDLAPGQTSGTIPFTYQPNTIDDFKVRYTSLQAHPVRGVMTDVYDGSLRLVDDDPAPKVTVRTPKRVDEGDRITVRVNVEGGASYPMYVGFSVVPTQGGLEPLRVADVPKAWLEERGASTKRARLPLDRSGVFVYDRIRPGGGSVTLSMPTRSDGVDEGVEAVTFMLDGRRGVRRTVRVVD